MFRMSSTTGGCMRRPRRHSFPPSPTPSMLASVRLWTTSSRTRRPATTTRIGQWGFNQDMGTTRSGPQGQHHHPSPAMAIGCRGHRQRSRLHDLSGLRGAGRRQRQPEAFNDGVSRGNEHRITVIRDDRPFNHSSLRRFRRGPVSGESSVFSTTTRSHRKRLADRDGQSIRANPGWRRRCKAVLGDGRVQHAGVILGVHGVAAPCAP